MKMIVGLGNPGPKYLLTRHNIGFLALDALAQRLSSASGFREDKKALVQKIDMEGTPVLLVKPQTFMNLSGEAVQALVTFYKIAVEDLLVIHDEVDLPFGQLKYQKNRGHGGHNGIRNIHQLLGTNAYGRLRLGVSRPSHPGFEVADYVLSAFSKEEQKHLPEFLTLSCESIEFFVAKGLDQTANEYNSQKGRIQI